jgi:hypothetical protein
MTESTTPKKRIAKKPHNPRAHGNTIVTAEAPSLNSREGRRAVTTAAGWKKSGSSLNPVELELPSGNVVLAKKPGLMNLLRENVLPDFLSTIAQEQVDAAKGKAGAKEPDFDFNRVMEERGPEGIAEFFEAFHRIAAHAVVEPDLRFHKEEVEYEDGTSGWELIPEEDRDDDAVYTDQVDENDCIFIGNWAMSGQTDMASFRS